MNTVTVEVELPADWGALQLPLALHDRLQELLDREEEQGDLTARERREAETLTQLVDMLALIRLRAESAQKRSA